MQVEGSKGLFVGGASGMCRATAEQFRAKGGQVAILDLAGSDGASVAQQLDAPFFACDVTDYSGMDAVIAEAVEARGTKAYFEAPHGF